MRYRVRFSLAVLCVPALALAQPKAPATTVKKAVAAKAIPASRAWHSKLPGQTAPEEPPGRPKLVLSALNFVETVSIPALTERGGFKPEDLDRAAHVLRDRHTGNEHPVDPRTLDLVYRLQVHFKAPEIRIISGYRTPQLGNNSNHGKGRAIDIVVPGATDEEVAKLAREHGFTGVGVYPTSGFVHVDVRERSYFWVDPSGPRQRSRIRGILADLAAKSDANALARGEAKVGPFRIDSDVSVALDAMKRERPLDPAANMQDDDDDVDTAVAP